MRFGIMAILALAALGSGACAGPASAPTAVAALPAAPAIALKPASIGPGGSLAIDGSGFTASARVRVALASAADAARSMNAAEIDANDLGRFKLVLVMPAYWDDSTPIGEAQLIVSAGAPGGPPQASAPLGFAPDRSLPPLPTQPPAATADASIAVAATAPPPPAEATPAETAAATAAPTATPQPVIAIEPPQGPVNTIVRVQGVGFPPGARVTIRLGVPEVRAGQAGYAEGSSDAAGAIDLTFTLPETWPDGQPVVEPILDVIAATADGATRGFASFAVLPPAPAADAPAAEPSPTVILALPSPSTPDPVQASIDFLIAFLQDPAGVSSAGYLSQRLQGEVRGGRTMLEILSLPAPFITFEVVIAGSGESSVTILATLNSDTGSTQRALTLVREGESWRIDSVE
jgi:hypothetical protein